ncbi:ABC transporter ATP-binding protein [uncultured Eubacterium sp.]|uniref:ABC transporter ATP-binding protein n=1 Tax=uncultured Eubacterium sp. TaxID=165185 RepID=UPI002672BC9B|nr:ABC transporter ATP-binding protein [uncultured Eubacterium sp.]
MLKINSLKKKFVRYNSKKKKEEFYADNDISFEAKEGEIVGILGPNGAGKTTLLRMIGGILEPTDGTIDFDGLNYKDNEIEIKKNIAYLSGNTKIYNSLSTYELLKMCCDFYAVDKVQAEERIQEVSNVLNMKEFLHNKIANLSTGQTQRVNIARCLIHNPKYYILDEATSGLDIISSQIILNFMKSEKQKGKTILYSTHYMEEAENICDNVVMINNGSIIKEGSPSQIKKDTNTTNLRDAFFTLIGGVSNEK